MAFELIQKNLVNQIENIEWSTRLKLAGICFGFGIYEVLSYKGSNKENKDITIDDNVSKNTGGSKMSFYLVGISVQLVLYYRYYKNKYLPMSIEDKHNSLTLYEKIGFAVAIFGFLFREYSKYVLGKHFTYVLSVQSDHKIIKKFPYSMVRHPGYTGMILLNIGCTIYTQTKLFGLLTQC